MKLRVRLQVQTKDLIVHNCIAMNTTIIYASVTSAKKTYHSGSTHQRHRTVERILYHIATNHNQDANEEDDVPEMAIQEPMPMDNISDEENLSGMQRNLRMNYVRLTIWMDCVMNHSCLILIVTRMNLDLRSHLPAHSLYWMDICIPILVQLPPMVL